MELLEDPTSWRQEQCQAIDPRTTNPFGGRIPRTERHDGHRKDNPLQATSLPSEAYYLRFHAPAGADYRHGGPADEYRSVGKTGTNEQRATFGCDIKETATGTASTSDGAKHAIRFTIRSSSGPWIRLKNLHQPFGRSVTFTMASSDAPAP